MARSSILPVRPPRRGSAEPLPLSIAPMLAVAGELPGDDRAFAYEFKWDGVRALCFWNGNKLRLLSRNLIDITRRYPELSDMGAALGPAPFILDGEIVALDETGRPSFSRLQRRMHVDAPQAAGLLQKVPIWFVLFDVLYSRGRSTLALAYQERRSILQELTVEGSAWQIGPSNRGGGEAMLAAATRSGLEGVVAKRIDSPYEPGRRSPSWVKIKVVHSQEFVIGGWLPEAGESDGRIGALLVGYHRSASSKSMPSAEGSSLQYAGAVGTGFTAATHALLFKRLKSLQSSSNPFSSAVPRKAVNFVRPELVAQVEFRRWPAEGLLQQAAFKGLRLDKEAGQVVREDHPQCPG